MWQQERFSRSKPWDWFLGRFRSRYDDERMTSIIDSEEVIRDEVEDALEKYGIQSTCYRLRLLMCPSGEGVEDLPGPEEWILCVALTFKTGEIVNAMSTLEKYLHRRLDRYSIRVRAVYWRVLAA